METIITIRINGEDVEVSTEIIGTEVEHKLSPYARYFDEECPAWSEDSEYNLLFLKSQQDYCNDMLKSRGYLFLNEVYYMLGIPRTKVGCIVGWVYDGCMKIDFGLMRDRNEKFINGIDNVALLDFNVDGCILDKI